MKNEAFIAVGFEPKSHSNKLASTVMIVLSRNYRLQAPTTST